MDGRPGDGGAGWQPLTGGGVPTSHLPFSSAARAGPFVFVSGQASVDASGAIVEGTFEEEMRRSIANLQAILRSLDLALRDVVKVTCYLADPADLTKYNALYRQIFDPPYPVRTTLTGCLSGLDFEIDAIAYSPQETSRDATEEAM